MKKTISIKKVMASHKKCMSDLNDFLQLQENDIRIKYIDNAV